MKGAAPGNNENHAESVVLFRDRTNCARDVGHGRCESEEGIPTALRTDSSASEQEGGAVDRSSDREGSESICIEQG